MFVTEVVGGGGRVFVRGEVRGRERAVVFGGVGGVRTAQQWCAFHFAV